MPPAAHDISSSSSNSSTLRRVLACAAAALFLSVTVQAGAAKISIVSDAGCPLEIEQARYERTPTGVVVIYTLRNDEDEHVRQLVLTAATLDRVGEVVAVRMVPLNERVVKHSRSEYRVTFDDLEARDGDRIVFGIQAVTWSGRRAEWRTALRLAGPASIAGRQ